MFMAIYHVYCHTWDAALRETLVCGMTPTNEKMEICICSKEIRDDCRQKYLKYRRVLVVIAELTKHCCTVVEEKHYSPLLGSATHLCG